MDLGAEGQKRQGRLYRFQFTPDQVLECGAAQRGKGSTWPSFSIPSHFIDSLIRRPKPWGFQRCSREPCCVARFHGPLMVVTPNNQPNTFLATPSLHCLLKTANWPPISWQTCISAVVHLLCVLCKLTTTLNSFVDGFLLHPFENERGYIIEQRKILASSHFRELM